MVLNYLWEYILPKKYVHTRLLLPVKIEGHLQYIDPCWMALTLLLPVVNTRHFFPYKPGPMPNFLGILQHRESKVWAFFKGLRKQE